MTRTRGLRLPPVVHYPHTTHHVGGWLPVDPAAIKNYLDTLRQKSARIAAEPLDDTVQEFLDLIESDPDVYEGANKMITQVPPRYEGTDIVPRLESYQEMCQLINVAIKEPPPYNDSDLVGFPINAILNWSMGTPAGTHFFLNQKVNDALKKILDKWGKYLTSEDSLIAFEDPPEGGGWMTPEAQGKIDMSMYEQPDPDALGWGYPSWNDWFIRKFIPGMRPVADPLNNSVISNACESTCYAMQFNVDTRSLFWIKGQPYSLTFMFNDNDLAEKFAGGTVYQAFLSAFNYHRWHSPVNGVVKKAYNVPGSYYAEKFSLVFDPAGPNNSQSYITNYAARAVIVIDAKEPVGEMVFVAVGMSEVSSCKISVYPGQVLQKGDELGYFLFGGSTHCLIFKPDVISEWNIDALPGGPLIPLNSYLGRAGPPIHETNKQPRVRRRAVKSTDKENHI